MSHKGLMTTGPITARAPRNARPLSIRRILQNTRCTPRLGTTSVWPSSNGSKYVHKKHKKAVKPEPVLKKTVILSQPPSQSTSLTSSLTSSSSRKPPTCKTAQTPPCCASWLVSPRSRAAGDRPRPRWRLWRTLGRGNGRRY